MHIILTCNIISRFFLKCNFQDIENGTLIDEKTI